MLACIACSTKHGDGSVESLSLDDETATPRSPATRDTIKSLTHQLKGMAVRFSAGAYRHCKPCTTAGEGGMMSHDGTPGHIIDSMDILDASSELSVGSSTHNSIAGSNLSSYYSTPAQSFKGTPNRSKRDTPTNHIAYTRHHSDSNNSSKRSTNYAGNNINRDTNGSTVTKAGRKQVQESRKQVQESPHSDGSTRLDHEQNEFKSECEDEQMESEKEWVAQVEPGVLITFVTLFDGGNDLKRIRFSREMFNKWQAQQWWAENCDKVHELYNVPKFSRMPGSLPTPSRSEDESYKSQSSGEFKKLNNHQQGRRQGGGEGIRREKGKGSGHARGASTVVEADLSCACAPSEWETASHHEDQQQEEATTHHQQPRLNLQYGHGDGGEEEWVQEDEPGVYITLISSNGSTELKRIRFSREKFTEMQARVWWEENRIRVYEQYL